MRSHVRFISRGACSPSFPMHKLCLQREGYKIFLRFLIFKTYSQYSICIPIQIARSKIDQLLYIIIVQHYRNSYDERTRCTRTVIQRELARGRARCNCTLAHKSALCCFTRARSPNLTVRSLLRAGAFVAVGAAASGLWRFRLAAYATLQYRRYRFFGMKLKRPYFWWLRDLDQGYLVVPSILSCILFGKDD